MDTVTEIKGAPEMTKPKWIKTAARSVDITDVWLEQVDPENESGDWCEAYFDCDASQDEILHGASHGLHRAQSITVETPRLVGIAISNDCGTVYRNREWAMKVLGYETVCRIEEVEERK